MRAELARIKRLVIRGHVIFTNKARLEMRADGLDEADVLESIVNARTLRSKRSRSFARQERREKVYIIVGRSFSGLRIYTKGVFRRMEDKDYFYLLISSKRSTGQTGGIK